MENRTLEDLRQGLLDGKLRIRHNGIDIFIDCMETKDMLVIPMTSAEGARREPRMERMTQDPDDGQGPYKGFLLIVCEECGAVKAFCAKRETWTLVPDGSYVYKASVECPGAWSGTWRPSIHMPKEAARIFLKVTDVHAERLQEITAEGALDEGTNVEFPEPKPSYISLAYTKMRLEPAARRSFANLWDSTIKPADRPVCGWQADPWVWVIRFERCERPEMGARA